MSLIINDSIGSAGISSIILIIGILLIAATVGSVITETPQDLSGEDINEIVNDVVNEITSYIQIKNILGKYYHYENSYTLQKIMLLITPLFHVDYDLSELKIQLQTKDAIIDLNYNQNALIPSGNLFSDSYWEYDKDNVYGCLVTLDKDESVSQFHTLNDPTDMVYLTINLPKNMYLLKGDKITISLIAGTGAMRSVFIEAPLPMSMIVQL